MVLITDTVNNFNDVLLYFLSVSSPINIRYSLLVWWVRFLWFYKPKLAAQWIYVPVRFDRERRKVAQ